MANGILRKPGREEKLRPATVRVNRLFSSIRCKIEKVFGWWKRRAGYRWVRYPGLARNRLEPETADQLERGMKNPAPNARRRAETSARKAQKPGNFQLGRAFSR